jgi:hypothetical protein
MAEQHSTQVNTAEISLAVFYRLDDCLREQERIAESIRFVLSLGNTTAPRQTADAGFHSECPAWGADGSD